MISVVPRYRTRVPAGVALVEWVNVTDKWLKLLPPGAIESVHVAPHCRIQISCAHLALAPELEGWLEGLELAGKLRRA